MYAKMTPMKKIVTFLAGLLLSLSVYAQSADVITELLDTNTATFGQISYLAAVQKNLINENDSYDKAVQALFDNGLIPNNENPDAPIPLIDIAYIYSKLWNVEGGLMYRLTKGAPRYVFKQFQADGIIKSNQEPGDYVSGARALSLYTSCVNKYSDFDMKKVSMEND